MKKILALSLALISFTLFPACGIKDTLQDAVRGVITGEESTTTKSSGGGTSATVSGSEADAALDALKDWAQAMGSDGEGYPFPKVETWREWPGSVWAELGLPDLTPDEYENGEVYNDGGVHIEGYSDSFVAQCNTEPESFDALAQTLWDAGVRGVHAGGGIIVQAEALDWLLEDDPNYRWFHGIYEHKGDLMEVYLQYTNGWDTLLWVGVTYLPSDPDFEVWDSMSWPSGKIEDFTGVNWPSPGGKIRGKIVEDDDYGSEIQLMVEGLSQSEFDSYLEKLSNLDGLYLDDNGSGWDFYGTYFHAFYPEDYDTYPTYIDIGYASGILFVSMIVY